MKKNKMSLYARDKMSMKHDISVIGFNNVLPQCFLIIELLMLHIVFMLCKLFVFQQGI